MGSKRDTSLFFTTTTTAVTARMHMLRLLVLAICNTAPQSFLVQIQTWYQNAVLM